ncbi:META domain-containing protein [Deinococcus psychrotolerans]|uniref:META domain-containing protein n=1 Tax=Deinococcus psychrotolerans TaxID=2489213 RepID=A0A3G8YCC8_9DEIO|nr:META domain-containing protein [Deinococcus psychrotolerans]AZI41857.1 META domain-containing protein [Deinococcus psychrotolerans]
MRPIIFLSFVLLPWSAAQAGNPAPLNGIWKLTQFSSAAPKSETGFKPDAQLFIVNGQLSGSYGCGTFKGTLEAALSTARIRIEPLPPKANVRCVFAVKGEFHNAMNAATQYTLSRTHLVLFSKQSRLIFERTGYVTPAKK